MMPLMTNVIDINHGRLADTLLTVKIIIEEYHRIDDCRVIIFRFPVESKATILSAVIEWLHSRGEVILRPTKDDQLIYVPVITKQRTHDQDDNQNNQRDESDRISLFGICLKCLTGSNNGKCTIGKICCISRSVILILILVFIFVIVQLVICTYGTTGDYCLLIPK